MAMHAWRSAVGVLAFLAGTAGAQVEAPLSTSFTYQGQLRNAGSAVSGAADFQFWLYDASVGGVLIAGPVTVLNVPVTEGVFAAAIDFGVAAFNGDNRYLQISVRAPAGGGVYSPVSGRQLLSATPYALQTRGLFTDAGLNVGVGGTPASSKLDVFGDTTVRGRVLVSSGTTPVITTGMNNANDKRMWMAHSTNFPSWGIQYRDLVSDGFPADSIEFVAGDQTHPRIGIALSSGTMSFYDGTGSTVNNAAVINTSTDGGLIDLYNSAGIRTVRLDGSSSAGFPGGDLGLLNRTGQESITLAADGGGYDGDSAGIMVRKGTTSAAQMATFANGGLLRAFNASGSARSTIYGNISGTGSGGAVFSQDNGSVGIDMRGSEVAGQGAQINLYRADGTNTISIDGDFNGDGRIITQELQITGGSDLSEQFDIRAADGSAAQPGMLVCIDPAHPGALVVSSSAYDKTVAGVVSGAGGVKPGLWMGQKGTAADGRSPVALTGRVYCLVDATDAAVEPGDLLTSSSTAGHAMKAADHGLSQGAVIGKAMTRMAKGEKGLVLVLVNLQ